VKTANVQCDNVRSCSSVGLTLPKTHLASVDHITAFSILYFILRTKEVYLLL